MKSPSETVAASQTNQTPDLSTLDLVEQTRRLLHFEDTPYMIPRVSDRAPEASEPQAPIVEASTVPPTGLGEIRRVGE